MGDSDTGRTWKTDYVGLSTIAFLQYGTTYYGPDSWMRPGGPVIGGILRRT